MNNRNLLRAAVLIAIALGFGLQALDYPIGEFSQTGPGLFPLIVSSFLLILGLVIGVRALWNEPVPLNMRFRNIFIVLLSLAGFAALSTHINVLCGIVFLVFCAAFAGSSYSVVRNVKITAGLAVIAFAFQKLLHLNIRLF